MHISDIIKHSESLGRVISGVHKASKTSDVGSVSNTVVGSQTANATVANYSQVKKKSVFSFGEKKKHFD